MKKTEAKQNNRQLPPEWVRFLEGFCGVKTYRWRDWIDFITEGQGGLANVPTDRELLETVKFVESQGESMETVTAKKLSGWVKWYRKTAAANRHGYGSGTVEGLSDAVWQAMIRAGDWELRWNILVEGGTPLPPDSDGNYQYRHEWTDNMRKETENRARRRWPDWDKCKGEFSRRLNKSLAVAGVAIARNMNAEQEVPF